jgi:hypothetical protein
MKKKWKRGVGCKKGGWCVLSTSTCVISQLIYDDIARQNVSSDSRKWLIKHLFPRSSCKKQINKQNSYLLLAFLQSGSVPELDMHESKHFLPGQFVHSEEIIVSCLQWWMTSFSSVHFVCFGEERNMNKCASTSWSSCLWKLCELVSNFEEHLRIVFMYTGNLFHLHDLAIWKWLKKCVHLKCI